MALGWACGRGLEMFGTESRGGNVGGVSEASVVGNTKGFLIQSSGISGEIAGTRGGGAGGGEESS